MSAVRDLLGARPQPGGAEGEPLAGRALLGAFVHERGGVEGAPAGVARLERAIGRRLDLVHDFLAWGRPLAQVADRATGRALLVSWQPTPAAVRDLAADRPDACAEQVLADLAARPEPTLLRFAHEMNGSWNSYSSASPGGPTAAEFRAAWRVLAGRLRALGGDVPLVWCPDGGDCPPRPGNRLEDYWPGADVVDVLGVDAYDWGTAQPRRGDGRDRSLAELVRAPYERLLLLPGAGHLPVWLCETGTTEHADDPRAKGDWYRAAYAVTEFPRLAAVVHFSEDDQRDAQRDWRLDSSCESLAGLRDALRRPVA
ncbi:glycosyl hydrolase [Pseudokineococcus marinus]|uniref:GH26 domain-containing protein n=1 Tax=Pseudokineococcus marinus TaxID=351215 RepID=A0A849BQF0_9ACTN|nr:glycosyl hydrolase [Pseudokineococcus marinus]NNH23217.1 hypothetical protein [Pseudokineococcus marinus]